MNSQPRWFQEQSREQESETSVLRRSLRELDSKFFQLERAFGSNLRFQRRREADFDRMKHETQELRKLNDETLRTKTELSSKLLSAIAERDHWKNAFLQQKESTKRKNAEWDDRVTSIKVECEDTLRVSRATSEKQFHELIDLRNKEKEKITQLEEEAERYRNEHLDYENRSFELANLLETLKRFDVDVGSICQLVAEVLKNLTVQGNLYDESMKNLRRLTWTTMDSNGESELCLLRKQNSVLKEVVKNLKRKVQKLGTPDAIAERENEHRNYSETQMNFHCDLPKGLAFNRNFAASAEVSMDALTQENSSNRNAKESDEHGAKIAADVTVVRAPDNRKEESDIDSRIIDTRGRVLCVESHSNGAFYEEYVFKLSIDREMKIKYPCSLSDNEEAISMKLVDDENEYENAPLDGMAIFLKNVYASVSVQQTGVSCATQTAKMKTCNSFVQTNITGVNSFSRLNAGVAMLNSEKRAIERSLCNLERTVGTLRLNALDQARIMLGKDSQFLENESFHCNKMSIR